MSGIISKSFAKTCLKRQFGSAAMAQAVTSSSNQTGLYPEYLPDVHIECEYRSNLWVATLPLRNVPTENLSVILKDRIIQVRDERSVIAEDREIRLPYDSISETVTAKYDSHSLVITAELENRISIGKPIPVQRL